MLIKVRKKICHIWLFSGFYSHHHYVYLFQCKPDRTCHTKKAALIIIYRAASSIERDNRNCLIGYRKVIGAYY
jgi:hypothetical protein